LKPSARAGENEGNTACEFRGTPKADNSWHSRDPPNYQHNLSSAALKNMHTNKTEVGATGPFATLSTHIESQLGELVLQRMRPLDAAIRHSTPHVQAGNGRAHTDKLAAGHISDLASDIRWMDHELDYLFAHAQS
jgi:hypothetical protein